MCYPLTENLFFTGKMTDLYACENRRLLVRNFVINNSLKKKNQ